MYLNTLKYFNSKNYNVSNYVNGVCIKHQNYTVYILLVQVGNVINYLFFLATNEKKKGRTHF